MEDFLKELEQYKGVSLARNNGNKLIFQRLPDRKRMSVMVYDAERNIYYIVGHISNEEKLKEVFLA